MDLEYGILATRTAGGVKENRERKKKEGKGWELERTRAVENEMSS